MGQYKVPQNVEAEDKILGPLTFRQFIYALIGVGWGILCFAILRAVPALLAVVGFPPTMLFLLLAFYTRDGQNFEQLLIAMVGFFAAARRRVWVKDPVAEVFHIEPTKHAAEITQRNPAEVISELEKLSTLIDSRGWNEPPQPENQAIMPTTAHEDRMVAPPPAPLAPDMPKTDMLDMKNSPSAQNLAELLREAAEDVREEAVQQMTDPRAKAPAALATAQASITGVTPSQPNDILKLATQNDDLSVSQIAAQATRLVPSANPQTVEPTNAS
ncbi:MAG TPA: PrgI family protein [Candidatus Saccharimonadia bacterium]